MVMLNMKSGIPIWEQIQNDFKRQILAGVLTPGDRLPSVRALAGELGINPNTIQRAYSELESAGFVYTVTGRGCFVSEANEISVINERNARLDAFRRALASAVEAGVEKNVLIQIVEKECEK